VFEAIGRMLQFLLVGNSGGSTIEGILEFQLVSI
jgi:hypothetical protein